MLPTAPIEQFLTILFSRKGPDQFIELRGLGGLRPIQKFTTSIAEANKWAVQNFQQVNVYAGVLPRTNDKDGTADNIDTAYWLWADIDTKCGDDLPSLIGAGFCLPATMIVASGSGGFHLYWAINPTPDIDKAVQLNNKIAKAISPKADIVGDAPRILRVAGTLNYKSTPPSPVALTQYNPDLVYDIEDIEAALKLKAKYHKLAYTGDTTNYKSRSERDFSLLSAMVKAGMSDDAITAVFTNRAVGDKTEESQHYFETSLAKLRSETVVENKWGIVEIDGCYWATSTDGALRQLSTFVFRPHLLLEGGKKEDDDAFIGSIVAGGRQWSDVVLTRKAFNSVDLLTRQLPKANWQWLGKDQDVKRWLPWLLDEMRKTTGLVKTRAAVPVIGRHGDVFVLPDQTINADGLLDPDAAAVAWLPTGRDYPKVRFEPSLPANVKHDLAKFIQAYFTVNTLTNTVLVLGYYVAALYKPVLEADNVRMPTLNLYGTRGSGKTTLITQVMQPLVGYEQSRSYDANTTQFVMLSLLGSSNSIPVSFSEFRRSSLRDPEKFIRYILLAYDNGHDSRGTSEQKTIDYALCAPFTIDGEDSINDAACLERIIPVHMRPETIAEATPAFAAFETIKGLDLNAIGFELLRFTLQQPIDFDYAMRQLKQTFDMQLPDRVRRNFALVLAGFNVFKAFAAQWGLQIDESMFNIADIFAPAIEAVVNTTTGRTALLVDDFVTDVINHINTKIVNEDFTFKYEPDTDLLYIHLVGAYNWWVTDRRKRGMPTLEMNSIKQQLRERATPEGMLPTVGNYIQSIGAKTVYSKIGGTRHATIHMYGISLRLAKEAGLDIPDKLSTFEPKISGLLADADAALEKLMQND